MLDGIELQLQPDALAALQSFYEEEAPSLAQVVSRGPDLPAYHSLEWRLQVQLAGRHAVASELQPSYFLRLHTEGTGGFSAPRAEHVLQALSPLPNCPLPPRPLSRTLPLPPSPSPPLLARPRLPSAVVHTSPLTDAGGLRQPAPLRHRAGRRATRGDLDALAPHLAPRHDPPRRVTREPRCA